MYKFIFKFFFLKQFINLVRKILIKLGISLNFSADGEDSIILKWIGGINNGFYLDIGSHKPLFGSNTFALYLNGWNGICLDPNPDLKLKYMILRPLDLFINSALISNNNKKKKYIFYYYRNNTDLNTFSKQRVDIQKKLYARVPSKILNIDLITVDKLIGLIDRKNIHFLNLDIEGLENEVLRSLLNKKIFPWCIAIEQLGITCENVHESKIKKYLNKKGYFLASRTFFTSIFIKKSIIKKLPSKYVKEIKRVN
tara:strand:- start:1062 stop:1823 length:762 start_codon:yes stop_codon:yes gene_type:complete